MDGEDEMECGEGNQSFESPEPAINEIIKSIAESFGVTNLGKDLIEDLGDNVTFILKLIIQQSVQFMDKNNHLAMTTEDVRLGMKSKGVEPIMTFTSGDPTLFKLGRGGYTDEFPVDEEVDAADFLNNSAPKLAGECTLKVHWLAIEGIQPSIPENPVPSYQENNIFLAKPTEVNVSRIKDKSAATNKILSSKITTYAMSQVQQRYFVEITDACIGADNDRREEALDSLATERVVATMLPRFCIFISEGVRVNAAQNNLALLLCIMRMCDSLVKNVHLNLESYLHQLLPSIITCIVCKQFCQRPDTDNHWTLREYSAELLCRVCKTFTTNINQLQSNVTTMLASKLVEESVPPSTLYGIIFFLFGLGHDSTLTFILPHVGHLSSRFSSIVDAPTASHGDRSAAEHLQSAMLKNLPPVIRHARQPPHSLEDFRSEYGELLGPLLHAEVLNLQQEAETTHQSSVLQTLSSGRSLSLSAGTALSHLGGQIGQTPSAGGLLGFSGGAFMSPPPNPQRVVFIAPQQRLTSSNNLQPTNGSAGSHLVRLIPASSATNQPSSNSNNY